MLTKVRTCMHLLCLILILFQATNLAKSVQNSPQHRDNLRDACERTASKTLALIQAIKTRWNSHGNCLLRTLFLKKAVKHLCEHTPELTRYEFTKTEWTIMQQLKEPMEVCCLFVHRFRCLPCIQAFIFAMEKVSKGDASLIWQVIPMIDDLNEMLTTLALDSTLHKSVRFAAYGARAVLNKYYSKTDDSVIFRVAISKIDCVWRYLEH
jgi:hypothetical protein